MKCVLRHRVALINGTAGEVPYSLSYVRGSTSWAPNHSWLVKSPTMVAILIVFLSQATVKTARFVFFFLKVFTRP